jgi:20S proteasome alpha/beta subunit
MKPGNAKIVLATRQETLDWLAQHDETFNCHESPVKSLWLCEGNNILDSQGVNCLGWPKPKRKKNLVTLIVGIVCKDAIVLAADSQTTYSPSKILGTNKISEIKFQNGKALIAESGFCSLSNAAVDAIQKKAEKTEIKNEETVAVICRQAVQEIRQQQISLFPRKKYSLTEWEYFFRDYKNFFLTLAYYFNEKPYLCAIDLSECTFRKPTFGFIVSGVGESVGNYMLKEEYDFCGGFEKMDSELAAVIAIKVADVAAEYVDGCGRPIKAALIQPPFQIPDLHSSGIIEDSAACSLNRFQYHMSDPVTIFPQQKVEEIAKIISTVERKAKTIQNKKIHKALRKQTEKAFEELMKDFVPNRQRGLTQAMRGLGKQTQPQGRSIRNKNKETA